MIGQLLQSLAFLVCLAGLGIPVGLRLDAETGGRE